MRDKVFILASGSQQRKNILTKLGIKYKAIPADIDEHHSGYKMPHAIVKSISLRKANTIAKKHPDKWVIGSDTIVMLSNGKISVKPVNRADALKTIKLYQNSFCDVYSGLAIVNKNLKKEFVGYEKTRIKFRNFSETEIKKYMDSGEWKGKSGSITIEGGGGDFVKNIEGCYWNVVGLPVDLLKCFLLEISNF